jgi:serine/threonine protein kinase
MRCEISTAGDVYSFGVILLEMLTGKHPTEDMFKNELTHHNFVESAFLQGISEILDSSLHSYCVAEEANDDTDMQNQATIGSQSCIKQLARLGLKCSVDSPKDRP